MNKQQAIKTYLTLIYETFQNIEEVRMFLKPDPEIENYENLVFNVKMTDTVENILEQEDAFKKKLFKLIPDDARTNFVLTIQIL